MRHYEIVVMVSAEQHDRATAMAQRYQSIVSDSGGAVHRFEDWGNRQLAYPINKRARARYFLFNVECGAETLNQLKEDFRYSESVIRSLVIRREEAVTAESPILTTLKNAANTADEEAAGAEQDDGDSDTAAAAADDLDNLAAEQDDDQEGSNEEKE